MNTPDQAHQYSPPTRSNIPDDTFEALRTLIHEQTGIYFQDTKRYLLENRLRKRLRAMEASDFDGYLQLLRNGRNRDELRALVNAITINETYFYRNRARLEVLRSTVLPELIAQKRKAQRAPSLRIWSAGCSNGAEPYSLAILLAEHIMPRHPDLRVSIEGTDINTDVLETAEKGVYRSYAVHRMPPELAKKYFRRRRDRYQLAPQIRRMVSFRQLNLKDAAAVGRMRSFDIIVCANVLIYFDDEARAQVVEALRDSLLGDGYLFIGFSESLHGATHAFRSVRLDKIVAYQKTDRPSAAHSTT